MPDHQHADPAAEGAAQLTAMVLSIGEGASRLRSERLAARAADDERQAAALRARHRTEQAAAWLTARTRSAQPGVVTPVVGNPAAPRWSVFGLPTSVARAIAGNCSRCCPGRACHAEGRRRPGPGRRWRARCGASLQSLITRRRMVGKMSEAPAVPDPTGAGAVPDGEGLIGVAA